MVGLLAIGLVVGAVALTGMVLTGNLRSRTVPAYAEFEVCGQGIRVGGDVKERGVLVGRIGAIERGSTGTCEIRMDLDPASIEQIPANVGAQIRAKTIFGEKWVELLYPDDPDTDRIGSGDRIGLERTIDPLEVETILNVAVPLLDAIDPEHLAGALEALASGFVGHEEAAIRGIDRGIDALRPMNENEDLLAEGIEQLDRSSAVLRDVDEDLLAALDNLDDLNRFTIENEDLIRENLVKAPRMLRELSILFENQFNNLTRIVDSGATVIGVVAARQGDLDRLLDVLPRFNSAWIRNINHNCRYRQATDEPGKSIGDEVPGRCWRVHNLISHSQGAYPPGEGPDDQGGDDGGSRRAAVDLDLRDLLYAFEESGL